MFTYVISTSIIKFSSYSDRYHGKTIIHLVSIYFKSHNVGTVPGQTLVPWLAVLKRNRLNFISIIGIIIANRISSVATTYQLISIRSTEGIVRFKLWLCCTIMSCAIPPEYHLYLLCADCSTGLGCVLSGYERCLSMGSFHTDDHRMEERRISLLPQQNYSYSTQPWRPVIYL